MLELQCKSLYVFVLVYVGERSKSIIGYSQAITNSNVFGHLAIRGANNWAIQELLPVHDLAKRQCICDDELRTIFLQKLTNIQWTMNYIPNHFFYNVWSTTYNLWDKFMSCFIKLCIKIFFTLSFSFKFVSITMIWLFCSQIIFQNADTVFSVGPEQNENINIHVIIDRIV